MDTKKITHGEYLQSAFADFERASSELSDFYASLEARVANLVNALRKAERSESVQLAKNAELNSRLTSLLEALPAGVVELARDGKIAHVNPAATSLLGDLQCGEQWAEVVARVFRPRWDDGHDVSLMDGRRVNIETAALAGKPGQILLIKDVTETRRLQERLNHHQRLSAKTEVAAALAHQVRTPLSTAILYLSNLRHNALEPDKATSLITKALKGMRHIEKIVADMLMFSRDHKFEMNIINPQEIFKTLASLSAECQANITIDEDCFGQSPVCVRGNHDALVSVIQNLVDNAVLAGAAQITVTAVIESSLVKITVADNGAGVDPKFHGEIFEPFFSTNAAGNGLGLAIARSVCRAHSGDLVLETGTHLGARFSVILPLLEEGYQEATKLKKAF